MKHELARLGAVGLLGGGLIVTSTGTAMAKSDVTLNATRKVVRAGQTIHLAGSAGDDAGLRKTRFCLEARRAEGRGWKQIGPCVSPYHADDWTADFKFDARPLTRGRYTFRAVGVGLRHRNHEIYGPSQSIGVTVR